MFVELSRNCGLRAVHTPQIFVVHVVDNAITAILQTAKFNRSAPVTGIERVVKFLIFADHMSFGKIEPYIVEIQDTHLAIAFCRCKYAATSQRPSAAAG